MDTKPTNEGLPKFGRQLLQHFSFDLEYRNLNHGSFGATPSAIQKRLYHYQTLAEAKPDPFIRYDAPKLLNASRAVVAQLLNAPLDTLVLVTNATVAINTILRNLTWNDDGKDEIVYFSSVYGGCGKTIDYIVDSNQGQVSSRAISLTYPIEDDEILDAFKSAVLTGQSDGKRARICVYDTVSSLPGVRFPFESITKACKDLGILSLVDGAQGIGQIKIDLEALDPDFFFTNCHKWLHVPRSCAALYVPHRNQDLITSTLPTSHGYVSKSGARFNPLPPPEEGKSAFVHNFEFVGSVDSSAYFCVKDAVEWRNDVLGGEDRIIEYTQWLAGEGGRKVAQILGTEVMENKSGTLAKCSMTNVALPMWVRPSSKAQEDSQEFAPPSGHIVLDSDKALDIGQWMLKVLMDDHKTYVALFIHGDRVWVRLSAQVYLDMEDFEWIGKKLFELCERVAKKEYQAKSST